MRRTRLLSTPACWVLLALTGTVYADGNEALDREVAAYLLAAETEPKPSFIQRIFDTKVFSLRQSATGAGAKEPATFSFLRTFGEDNVYAADFAMVWKWDAAPGGARKWRFAIEGKVASDESEAEDAWRVRFGVLGRKKLKNGRSWRYAASLKYETDRDLDTQKISLELEASPIIRKWAIGKVYPRTKLGPDGRATKRPPYQIIWYPTFSLDTGYTIDAGDSEETEDFILRPRVRVRFYVVLNRLTKLLHGDKAFDDTKFPKNWDDDFGPLQVYFVIDNHFIYTPLEDSTTHNFLRLGLGFPLTSQVGFTVTFRNGEEAPNFQRIKTLGIEIGVRF